MSLIPFSHVALAYVPTATFGTVTLTSGFDGTYYGYSKNDYPGLGSTSSDTLIAVGGTGELIEAYSFSITAFEIEFASNADALTALADAQALYTGVKDVSDSGIGVALVSSMTVSGARIVSTGNFNWFGTDGNTYTLEWY